MANSNILRARKLFIDFLGCTNEEATELVSEIVIGVMGEISSKLNPQGNTGGTSADYINGATEKMKTAISAIERNLGIKFVGTTWDDAKAFISDNIDE